MNSQAAHNPSQRDANCSRWPELSPLDGPVRDPFPTDVLPEPLRSWVLAEAEATQTPAILPALLAMAVVAATIAKRVCITPWQGWTEPTNLFVAPLLDPGNRKSVVFSDATRPLRELETELIDAMRPVVARAEAERRMQEKELKALEEKAKGGNGEARDAALQLAERITRERLPKLPRRIVDNATPEKLEVMLAEQDGLLASMSPEGGVFDLMAGRYSDGMASFDVYLKGHSGDELRTDRVGRESVYVEAPALTAAYAIQPEVIRGLAGKSTFRGRGLLGRFLWAIPYSPLGHRKIRPTPMSPSIREAYRLRVRDLAQIDGNHELTLQCEAETAFEQWGERVESMLAEGGELESVRDWGGKLVGATARIAANLHMVQHGVDGPQHQVSVATVLAAKKIACALIPHAQAAIRLLSAVGPADAGASAIVRWIRNKQATTFTANAVWQSLRRSFHKRPDLDPALRLLVDRGYIRRLDSNERGRPSERYETNPLVLQHTTGTRNTQNAA